ncbi:MAG: histidine kinase [Bacteroidota bacterium]
MTVNSTGTKKFFIAQAFGWALFGVGNFFIQWMAGIPFIMVATNTGMALFTGLVITTIYRYLIRSWHWQEWRLLALLMFIAFSSFLIAVAWLLLNAVLFQLLFPIFQITAREILGNLINGGLIFLIWNLIYFFFKYFAKSRELEIDKWRLATEVKEAQLGNLRAKLRPHFVFNTLNNIKALVLEDPQRSREMLINFSDLLRYSLQHDEQRQVPLSEEVEISRQYLELMSIQYEDRLQWSMDIDPQTPNCLVPPMLLQLLVENAVKHGIAPEAAPGELNLKTTLEKEQLLLEVSNSGNLRRRKKVEGRLGTGLQNIRERLRIFYGDRAAFDLKESGHYVLASICLPLETRT